MHNHSHLKRDGGMRSRKHNLSKLANLRKVQRFHANRSTKTVAVAAVLGALALVMLSQSFWPHDMMRRMVVWALSLLVESDTHMVPQKVQLKKAFVDQAVGVVRSVLLVLGGLCGSVSVVAAYAVVRRPPHTNLNKSDLAILGISPPQPAHPKPAETSQLTPLTHQPFRPFTSTSSIHRPFASLRSRTGPIRSPVASSLPSELRMSPLHTRDNFIDFLQHERSLMQQHEHHHAPSTSSFLHNSHVLDSTLGSQHYSALSTSALDPSVLLSIARRKHDHNRAEYGWWLAFADGASQYLQRTQHAGKLDALVDNMRSWCVSEMLAPLVSRLDKCKAAEEDLIRLKKACGMVNPKARLPPKQIPPPQPTSAWATPKPANPSAFATTHSPFGVTQQPFGVFNTQPPPKTEAQIREDKVRAMQDDVDQQQARLLPFLQWRRIVDGGDAVRREYIAARIRELYEDQLLSGYHWDEHSETTPLPPATASLPQGWRRPTDAELLMHLFVAELDSRIASNAVLKDLPPTTTTPTPTTTTTVGGMTSPFMSPAVARSPFASPFGATTTGAAASPFGSPFGLTTTTQQQQQQQQQQQMQAHLQAQQQQQQQMDHGEDGGRGGFSKVHFEMATDITTASKRRRTEPFKALLRHLLPRIVEQRRTDRSHDDSQPFPHYSIVTCDGHKVDVRPGPRNVLETLVVFVVDVMLHREGEVAGLRLTHPINLASILDS